MRRRPALRSTVQTLLVLAVIGSGASGGQWLTPERPLVTNAGYVPEEAILPSAHQAKDEGRAGVRGFDLRDGRRFLIAAWGGSFWWRDGQLERTSLDLPGHQPTQVIVAAAEDQLLWVRTDGSVWRLDLSHSEPRPWPTRLPAGLHSLRVEADGVRARGQSAGVAWERRWDEASRNWI